VSAALGARTEAAEGAVAATRALYERHGRRVFSFCLGRLRDREEAQDAAQTTFVYVLRALDRGVVPRNELAWLLTIAQNVCRSSRRSRLRNPAASCADPDALAVVADPTEPGREELLSDLREALAQLPENQRRAVLMREWQGLSYADIADELQLSVAAVETLLFRARKGLQCRLERVRARLGVVDLGSLLSLVKSLQPGIAAKVAVAGLAVASVPVVAHEVAMSEPPAVQPAAVSSVVAWPAARVVRVSPTVAQQARRITSAAPVGPPGRRTARVRARGRVSPTLAAAPRIPRAPGQAPVPTYAETTSPAQTVVDAPVADAPALEPVLAPVVPVVQTVVDTVTQTLPPQVPALVQDLTRPPAGTGLPPLLPP
jgi:RNA polymerase sigma factor (sigma-70 family)